MKILARNFDNRGDLEKEVEGKDPKTDTIEGTRLELERFNLSDRSKIFGLKVVITDSPTPQGKLIIRPKRS